MNNVIAPHLWKAPDWHSDWGSSTLEFDELRKCAIAILDGAPDCSVQLEVPEPGLMYVLVTSGVGRSAEVYSIESPIMAASRRLKIYTGTTPATEMEFTESSIERAAERIIQELS